MIDMGICDVCGQPAITMVTDLIEHRYPGQLWEEHSPGSVRRGCAEHPPIAEEHVSNQPPPWKRAQETDPT